MGIHLKDEAEEDPYENIDPVAVKENIPDEKTKPRVFKLNDEVNASFFPSNYIRTTRYTKFNFLPKSCLN